MDYLSSKIYLDYAATTPVDPRVLEVMMPFFSEQFGNPSSVHYYGQLAEAALEDARERIARNLGARSTEIIFTGCGTESDNLAIRGVAMARREATGANCILTTPVEHHAVLHTVEHLVKHQGFKVESLPVDRYGMVEPDEVRRRLTKNTALVSVIYANNEIGTINPVAEIGLICRQHGIPFHSDAVQAAAYLPMQTCPQWSDLISIGAHKMYGPKGAGVLYVRDGTPILPAQTGGGQENGLRAGTQNVPYIIGMAKAFDLSQQEMPELFAPLANWRDEIIQGVIERIPGAQLTGHRQQRLPNHASFVFEGVDGNHLLMMLDAAGFACSSGSACKTGNPKPSDVLLALGLHPQIALGSLRVTIGKPTSGKEIRQFIDALPRMVAAARALAQ